MKQKASPRLQVCSNVAKASDLCVLRCQHEEGVEHDEDERERAVDRNVGHIADRDRDALAAGLLAHLLDDRRRGIDAVNLDATRSERERDSARANTELEY